MVDAVPDVGGAVGCADAGGAPATEAPPLLTGSCIVVDVAAVPPGSESLPTVAVVVLVSGGSSPFSRVFFSSARILLKMRASSPFFRLRASAAPSGDTDGAFEGGDDSTADSFPTVLMGSLLVFTH